MVQCPYLGVSYWPQPLWVHGKGLLSINCWTYFQFCTETSWIIAEATSQCLYPQVLLLSLDDFWRDSKTWTCPHPPKVNDCQNETGTLCWVPSTCYILHSALSCIVFSGTKRTGFIAECRTLEGCASQKNTEPAGVDANLTAWMRKINTDQKWNGSLEWETQNATAHRKFFVVLFNTSSFSYVGAVASFLFLWTPGFHFLCQPNRNKMPTMMWKLHFPLKRQEEENFSESWRTRELHSRKPQQIKCCNIKVTIQTIKCLRLMPRVFTVPQTSNFMSTIRLGHCSFWVQHQRKLSISSGKRRTHRSDDEIVPRAAPGAAQVNMMRTSVCFDWTGKAHFLNAFCVSREILPDKVWWEVRTTRKRYEWTRHPILWFPCCWRQCWHDVDVNFDVMLTSIMMWILTWCWRQ